MFVTCVMIKFETRKTHFKPGGERLFLIRFLSIYKIKRVKN